MAVYDYKGHYSEVISMDMHSNAFVEMAVHDIPVICLPVTGIETVALAAAPDVA